jgi:hypothetical protein
MKANEIVKEEHLDHEVRMAKAELMTLAQDSMQLLKLLNQFADEEKGIPGWVASKITKAQDYINSVHRSLTHDALDGEIHEEATAGATAAGNIASVANPHVTNPYRKGSKKHKKPVSVSALDAKNVSIFGGPLKRP